MLTYVAAVATAATLMISPILARDDVFAREKADAGRWTIPAATPRSVAITTTIAVTSPPAPYYLSPQEQRILKKALIRSARIVHEGERLA